MGFFRNLTKKTVKAATDAAKEVIQEQNSDSLDNLKDFARAGYVLGSAFSVMFRPLAGPVGKAVVTTVRIIREVI